MLIRNGVVYDPLNGIEGEVMDIAIKDGKIVPTEKVDPKEAYVIDARGMLVVPGGIDLHTHVAGPKVNLGRVMRPEDHRVSILRYIPGRRHSGSGKTTPSTTVIGYRYIRMGYTMIIEPASPPIKSRHTHEELDDIPYVDKAMLPLFDSNWFILKFIREDARDKVATYIAWLLRTVKGYAVKLVDPGAGEAWGWGRGIGISLDDEIPGWGVKPRDIIEYTLDACIRLGIPHKVHIHCNRLGFPGNYETTLETIRLTEKFPILDRPIMHITHIQFNAYGGETWGNLRSASEELAREINRNPRVSIDLGQVIFGTQTTMTADAPYEYVLYHLTKWKWSSTDAECECAAGIVPYKYRKKSYVNTIQWCIGLEIALLVRDPWRVVISTDHPNGGPFTRYPWIVAWLMSKRARDEVMKKLNERGLRKCILPSIDREYTWTEFVIITRAAPAKLLGLEKTKGHLGVGADADVAIYDIDPREVDPSRDYEKLIKALRRAKYVIKGGEVVVKDGEVTRVIYGSTYYINPVVSPDLEKSVKAEIEQWFKRWYSVSLSTYEVRIEELRSVKEVKVISRV
ncbi:MAG: formylmethanofuran dehydrogenase subunit A [Thermoprotei archaeon]|nr:MAG: formylmethanofuran dehydrogenase subunit A [Thermoprotei archaeon]